jgi:hypothetical protein
MPRVMLAHGGRVVGPTRLSAVLFDCACHVFRRRDRNAELSNAKQTFCAVAVPCCNRGVSPRNETVWATVRCVIVHVVHSRPRLRAVTMPRHPGDRLFDSADGTQATARCR